MDTNDITSLVAELTYMLKDAMNEAGAGNYMALELGEEGTDSRYLALFVRLPEGKTPMEMHQEALDECERLRRRIAKIREALQEIAESECGDYATRQECVDI